MLDLKFVRGNIAVIRKMLADRNNDLDISRFEELDAKRRNCITALEELRFKQNNVNDEIARMRKQGQDSSSVIAEMKEVSANIKNMEKDLAELEPELNSLMMLIPNIPHKSVPVGKSEEYNRVERLWGEKPIINFQPAPHWDIGEKLGLLDFSTGAKITGARFTLYRGAAARLERAIVNFMLDLHTSQHGYMEVLPPFMVNSASMTGTGQLPKFQDDLFKVAYTDYWLIPTAEVPVTNIHRDEIVSEALLPIKYVAYTPCFRSEAGSYGKDTRGLIRQHQFNKVELVKFSHPDNSYNELESLTNDAEEVLKRLGLHYRVVTLCSGDMGFSSAKTYDIEVWLPGQGLYREISSCSNFEDFQSRRAGIRFKGQGKGTSYVHTLNGSGLAVGRTLVAVLENYQQSDGSVLIPEALQPYMGGMTVISEQV